MMFQRWPRLGSLAALAALVLSASFFLTPLAPWPDQGTMLEAAVRHAAGHGLTVGVPTMDLTRVEYRRLSYFPPLYPLIVSIFLRLGLTVTAVVKLCNAGAVVIGCLGWCALARTALGPGALAAFSGLLVVTGGALLPKGGTTDMLLWAGLPVWMLLVLQGCRQDRLGPAAGWFFIASGWAGLLIGVRWAAVFVVIAGCVHSVSRFVRSDPLRGLLLAAVHGAPATALYWSYGALNRAYGGSSGNYLDHVKPQWDFSRLLAAYPLEALTTVPLGLEPLLRRLLRALDPAQSSDTLALALRLGLPALALLLLGWGARRPPPGAAVRLGFTTAVVLVVFLAFMTVRFNWEASTWTYLAEPRYFRPLWPVALLVWLAWIEQLPRSRRLAAGAVLAVAALYLLQAHLRWEGLRFRPQEASDLTAEVLRRTASPGLHVVLDNDVSTYVLAGREDVLLSEYPAEDQTPRLRIGHAADLWVVWRPREPTAYLTDRDRDRRRVDALRQRFAMEGVWTSSGGSYELFHAFLSPGPNGSALDPEPPAR